MSIELNQELVNAIFSVGHANLEVIDPRTQKTYVFVERETHRQAMEALRRQQDREAIAQGIRQMEAGQGESIEQAFTDLQEQLGYSK